MDGIRHLGGPLYAFAVVCAMAEPPLLQCERRVNSENASPRASTHRVAQKGIPSKLSISVVILSPRLGEFAQQNIYLARSICGATQSRNKRRPSKRRRMLSYWRRHRWCRHHKRHHRRCRLSMRRRLPRPGKLCRPRRLHNLQTLSGRASRHQK